MSKLPSETVHALQCDECGDESVIADSVGTALCYLHALARTSRCRAARGLPPLPGNDLEQR